MGFVRPQPSGSYLQVDLPRNPGSSSQVSATD
jgi:hypothetical protein